MTRLLFAVTAVIALAVIGELVAISLLTSLPARHPASIGRPGMSGAPIKYCLTCRRERDCLLHIRAEFPPDAAEKWLRKSCPVKGKPCEIAYRAGIA